MSIVSDVLERARTLIFRAREERELEEEIRFHIDMEAEQQRRAGMDAAEARRRGMLVFGGVERIKEDVRDARGTRLLEESAGDVRWSLRTLRRTLQRADSRSSRAVRSRAVASAIRASRLPPVSIVKSSPGSMIRAATMLSSRARLVGFLPWACAR